MKSYNHLWESLISDITIKLAINSACKSVIKRKNKRTKHKLYNMVENTDQYIPVVRDWIENYEPFNHDIKIINDGISMKKREIICPNITELIIQHAVIIVLQPIIMKGMYEHSYASVPKRGCHLAMKRINKWIKKDYKNTKYCLKLDIYHFFQSISQDYLINKFKKIIHDEKFMNLLIKIIRTTEYGIPLGFYTSQWFANFLLQDLDHFIKEDMGVKYYVRFMDDMVLFGSNKRKLHRVREQIQNFIDPMSLKIKDNWQLFKMHNEKDSGRFLDFLGFKFYRNRVTMRKKICRKAMKKAIKISKKDKITVHDARQMMTYIGWMKYTNTYSWYLNHIKPYINIKQLKRIISDYDKRRNSKNVAKVPIYYKT